MTGYSSGVNGKNKAKKKAKSQVFYGEEAVCHGEEVRHGEGCYSPRRRGSWMKNQSQVHCSEEAIRHGEGCCLP